MPTPRTAFRIEPELLARIDARAKAEGVNRTVFVVAAVEDALAEPRRVAPQRTPPTTRRNTLDGKMVHPKDCPHPITRRIKGTAMCGVCGGTVK